MTMPSRWRALLRRRSQQFLDSSWSSDAFFGEPVSASLANSMEQDGIEMSAIPRRILMEPVHC